MHEHYASLSFIDASQVRCACTVLSCTAASRVGGTDAMCFVLSIFSEDACIVDLQPVDVH